MPGKKIKHSPKPRSSFFMKAADGFSSFIYSMFANGRAGSWLSTKDNLYVNSRSAKAVEKTARSLKSESSKYTDLVMDQSKAVGAPGKLREFLSCLGLNVYGCFLLTYGLTAVFMYYITILLNGRNTSGVSSLLTAIFSVICSIPLLVSSGSASVLMCESKIMRRFVLSFLSIPEEKLRTCKYIGGTEYMFMAAFIAIILGVLTYFMHAAYMLIMFAALLGVFMIMANPETGVILTLAASPFLQYTAVPEIILVVLILLTIASYVSKLLRHRRTLTFSSESMVAIVFCGFMIVASLFASGGVETIVDALISVVIVFGGFFITHNLIRGEKRLFACTKILAASFIVLCVLGVWNVFFDGVSDKAMYSMKEYIQPIFEGQNLYIADSAQVFSVLAILVTPVVISYAARQKSAKGVAAIIGLLVLIVAAVFIYGTYETVIAIVLEFGIFWLLYSYKTLKTVLFLLLPVGIFVLIYPYLAQAFGWSSIPNAINEIMPLGFAESASYLNVTEDSLAMILDGNLTGIGAGKHAFISSFTAYSDVVSASAENPGMFILQIVCWSGVGGLLAFSVFTVILMKKSLGYLAESDDNALRCETLALTVGIVVALIFGNVCCIWDDPRMLYIFWVSAGLLTGTVREGRERMERRNCYLNESPDAMETEFRFYK